MKNGSIEEIDLGAWVAAAPLERRRFREAVHIVLTAISASVELRARMIMKGGMLMAIRYHSDRFTKDADFSTRALYSPKDAETLVAELDRQVTLANERLSYDTLCRLQSHEVRPARQDATFPTLSCSIGYGKQSLPSDMRRIGAKQAVSIVKVECSFNEAVLDVDTLSFTDDGQIEVYSLLNLFAEKLRALLQQPGRKRARRQDVYDLHLLLTQGDPMDVDDRRRLLHILRETCSARDIEATPEAFANPQIREWAEKEYESTAAEIGGPLPAFDDAFTVVKSFFEGLPWQK